MRWDRLETVFPPCSNEIGNEKNVCHMGDKCHEAHLNYTSYPTL